MSDLHPVQGFAARPLPPRNDPPPEAPAALPQSQASSPSNEAVPEVPATPEVPSARLDELIPADRRHAGDQLRDLLHSAGAELSRQDRLIHEAESLLNMQQGRRAYGKAGEI